MIIEISTEEINQFIRERADCLASSQANLDRMYQLEKEICVLKKELELSKPINQTLNADEIIKSFRNLLTYCSLNEKKFARDSSESHYWTQKINIIKEVMFL